MEKVLYLAIMRSFLYKSFLLGNLLVSKNRFLYKLALNIYRKTLKPLIAYKDRKILSKYGTHILSSIHNTFESQKIEYIIAFGTLLGFIRDKNFIPYDTDIDIIVIESTNFSLPKGFKRTKEIYIDNNLVLVGYEFKGINIDIFIATRKGDAIYCYDFPNHPGMNWYETIIKLGGVPIRQFIFPYTKRILYSINMNNQHLEIYIPKEWDEHLKIVYGEKYLKPDPNWNALNIKHPNVKLLSDKLARVVFL